MQSFKPVVICKNFKTNSIVRAARERKKRKNREERRECECECECEMGRKRKAIRI